MNKKLYFKLCLTLFTAITFLFTISFNPNAISKSISVAKDKIATAKIDEYIKSEIESSHIPGLVLGIVKDNEVYVQGYGRANNNGDSPTPSTPFIIGSLSKSFTALAIMQLRDEGKLDLDAPVQKYLPWFTVKNTEAASKITIRNLLNQTSGFSLYSGLDQFAKTDKTSDDLVKDQQTIELTQPVGSYFQYSNCNFILLGKIIEEVSGLSYGEYIDKHVFTPLDMKNTFVSQEDGLKNNMAQGFSPWFGFYLSSNIKNAAGNAPAGYLLSSAEDMTHYLKAQLNNGLYNNTLVTSPKSIEEMHTPSVAAPIYGMGWFTEPNKIWHDGLVPNFRSYMRIDPNNKIGFFFSFNTSQTLLERISRNDSEINRLASGIYKILNNETPPTKGNGVAVNNILRVIMALIIASSIYSLIRLLRFIKNIKKDVTKPLTTYISSPLLHFILSTLIFVLCPKIFFSPWCALLLYAPDLSRVLLLLSGVHLLIAIIEAIFIISCYFKRKNTVSL